MVGSVSYLHCAISKNISVIDEMVSNATKGVKVWSQAMGALYHRRLQQRLRVIRHHLGLGLNKPQVVEVELQALKQ